MQDPGSTTAQRSHAPTNKTILKQITHMAGKIKGCGREKPGFSPRLSAYITGVHRLEPWVALRRVKAPPGEGLLCMKGTCG